MDNLESRHFLCYEQDRLVCTKCLSNQVRDGLRLSSSGWSFDDKVFIIGSGCECAKLTRICINDVIGRLYRKLLIQVHFTDVLWVVLSPVRQFSL